MNYSHFQYMHLGTLFSWLKTTASNTIFGHSVKLFNWLTVGNNISYSQLICKLKNRKRARARQFNFLVKSIAPPVGRYSKGRDLLLHLPQRCQIWQHVLFFVNFCKFCSLHIKSRDFFFTNLIIFLFSARQREIFNIRKSSNIKEHAKN